MFKHVALFRINGKDLYRKENIIDEIFPELFICEDESGGFYVAFLLDFYTDEYIICPITERELVPIRNNDFDIEQVFTSSPLTYYVTGGATSDLSDDIVKSLSQSETAQLLSRYL